MKLYEKVCGKIPEILDLPDQTLPGVPIIEIYGNKRLLIEGRCSVIDYCESCIKLKNTYGNVCILGRNLIMSELTQQQMIIVGEIDNLSISRGG